jgi:hypothetical protein
MAGGGGEGGSDGAKNGSRDSRPVSKATAAACGGGAGGGRTSRSTRGLLFEATAAPAPDAAGGGDAGGSPTPMQHSVTGPYGAKEGPRKRAPSLRAPFSASTNAPAKPGMRQSRAH